MSTSEARARGPEPLQSDVDAELKLSHEKRARVAALILEVLVGERTSGEAAAELGISSTRYYTLEERAVNGLVEACAPRPRGPSRDPEREILKLKAEVKRLESLCRRTASLLRLSQRSLGVRPSVSTASASSKRSNSKASSTRSAGKRKRARRSKARALRLVKKLRSEKPRAPKSLDVMKDHGDNPGEVRTVKS